MSEDKLSVRLEEEAQFRSRPGDFSDWVPESDKALAALLTEAAQLARRVEEAPRCLICDEGDYLSAVPSDGESFITAGRLVGQRVRLVRDE